MSGNRSIVLEIYGLKGGRWSIHSNYSIQEREDCLEDAKDLDAKGKFEAVCVVREMCTGKSYKFDKKGDFDLKGFPEPVPIFLVDWAGGLNAPEKPGS